MKTFLNGKADDREGPMKFFAMSVHAILTRTGSEIFLKAVNDDITCRHGRLSLNKRSYRAISNSAWTLIKSMFPVSVDFAMTTTPCSQCQVRTHNLRGYGMSIPILTPYL